MPTLPVSRSDGPARRVFAALLPALLYLLLKLAVQAGLRALGLSQALCALIAVIALALPALLWYRQALPQQSAVFNPSSVSIWLLFALGFSAALQLLPGAKTAVDVSILSIAAYAFAAPAAEELVYRGLVFQRGLSLLGRRWAMTFSTLLFAAGHSMSGFLPAAFFGLALAFLVEVEHCLLPSLIVHILVNLMSYIWQLTPLPVPYSILGAAASLVIFIRLALCRCGDERK